MRDYRHIIFDIDGTLLDTENAILQSLKDTIVEILHKDVPMKELKFALGIPGEDALRVLGIKDTLSANRKWNEHLLKYKRSIKLFEGIPELLRELKSEGYVLGIVTSKDRHEFATDFVPFGIADYFDRVICVEDAPRPKPNPAPLTTYLTLSGIDAKQALYVGDTVYDSRCAQDAGVDFGLALWGGIPSQEIPADYLFQSPTDVRKCLPSRFMDGKRAVYNYLDSRNIHYEVTEHKAVYNMNELFGVTFPYQEAIAKNLFVRDDKKHNYYLITVKGDKRVDLRAFREKFGTRPLSFADKEDLWIIMKLLPGIITPFGILNDKKHKVQFFLDEEFLEPPTIMGIHPNDNTATVWIRTEDLLNVIKELGTMWQWVTREIIKHMNNEPD